MMDRSYLDLNREAWDADSEEYQEIHRHDLDFNLTDILWGFGHSKESELGVLENIVGKAILELGCGGAQCSIPLCHFSTCCVGLDISGNQLHYAKKLSAQNNSVVELVMANAEDLPFCNSCFDIVFCVFGAVGFVDIGLCFREVYRVLKIGGLFAFSWYHPFFDCFSRTSGDQLKIVKSYFDKSPITERKKKKDGTEITYVEFHHTLSEWYTSLTRAGFVVMDIIEPAPSEDDRHGTSSWLEASPSKTRIIPASIIWKACKPKTVRH
jgi:ubiquinone/menaquinone biosynthesis C-methylase UbiE